MDGRMSKLVADETLSGIYLNSGYGAEPGQTWDGGSRIRASYSLNAAVGNGVNRAIVNRERGSLEWGRLGTETVRD